MFFQNLIFISMLGLSSSAGEERTGEVTLRICEEKKGSFCRFKMFLGFWGSEFSESTSSKGLSKNTQWTAKQSHRELQNSCWRDRKVIFYPHRQSQNIEVWHFNKCICFGLFWHNMKDWEYWDSRAQCKAAPLQLSAPYSICQFINGATRVISASLTGWRSPDFQFPFNKTKQKTPRRTL